MNEKTKKVLTYILYVLLMHLFTLIGISMFRMGAYVDFVGLPIVLLLSWLAYKKTSKILDLLFLDFNLLLSVYLGSRHMTILYYNNVSSDHMTLVVGNILTGVMLLIVAVVASILLIARIILIIIEKRRQKKGAELCSD